VLKPDAFLQLRREDPARIDGHLAQWLFTVCRNRALDEAALSEQPSLRSRAR
jgi:hypothetical protein